MMALFLQDLLTVLYKGSLKFQEGNSVVSEVSLCIKTSLARIRSLEKMYVFPIYILTFCIIYFGSYVYFTFIVKKF